MWDLLWFFVFGVAFVAVGWMLKIRKVADRPSRPSCPGTLLMAIAAGVAGAGILAALPPQGTTSMIVLFKANTTPLQVARALDAVEVRVLWADRSGAMWAINMKDKRRTTLLYRHGALLVSNASSALGCLSWIRA